MCCTQTEREAEVSVRGNVVSVLSEMYCSCTETAGQQQSGAAAGSSELIQCSVCALALTGALYTIQ